MDEVTSWGADSPFSFNQSIGTIMITANVKYMHSVPFIPLPVRLKGRQGLSITVWCVYLSISSIVMHALLLCVRRIHVDLSAMRTAVSVDNRT